MTLLLILRHGPTDWNAQKRVQGHTDIPLSAQGRAEVKKWAIPVEFKHFSCVSSPLIRAVETAKILGLKPNPVQAFFEMSWGQWEGRTLTDLRAELGSKMAENEARGLDFCPTDGESPRMVQDRLRSWLQTLTKPTIAVSHKGVIRALYAMASGWDMRQDSETELLDKCAHLFKLDGDGQVTVKQLNIKLYQEFTGGRS